MKRFEFSLQKVLEYKTHIEKNQADVLGAMQAEYMQLSKKRDAALAEYERNKLQFQAECKVGLNVRKAAAAGYYIREQSQQIIKLNLQLQEQMIRIDSQRKCLISVTQDKTMIQKLKEHAWDAYIADQQKREELLIEEFISNKSVCEQMAGAQA